MSESEEIDDLADAIIEDTVHCDLCGGGYDICGGGICVQLTEPAGGTEWPQDRAMRAPQLKLCIECAGRVAIAHKQALLELDICEHGIVSGDWCEACNKAYKNAIFQNGLEAS